MPDSAEARDPCGHSEGLQKLGHIRVGFDLLLMMQILQDPILAMVKTPYKGTMYRDYIGPLSTGRKAVYKEF